MVVGKKSVMVASDKIFTLNSAKFYRYWLTGGLAPHECSPVSVSMPPCDS